MYSTAINCIQAGYLSIDQNDGNGPRISVAVIRYDYQAADVMPYHYVMNIWVLF